MKKNKERKNERPSVDGLMKKIDDGDCIVIWSYDGDALLQEFFGNGYGPSDYHLVTREMYYRKRSFFEKEGVNLKYFEGREARNRRQ